MKFQYNPNQLKGNSILGFASLGLGGIFLLLHYTVGEYNGFPIFMMLSVGQITSAAIGLIMFSYQKRKQYLSLEEGVLVKNSFFPKKICLQDVKTIKEYAGKIYLKGGKEDFIIEKQMIDEKALELLQDELQKLGVYS